MVALFVLAIVGVNTTLFAAAVTSGAIFACVNNSSGTIHIVTSDTTCSKNETLLSWTSAGSVGPAGPTGATGPQGPTGATGVTGPAGPGMTTHWVSVGAFGYLAGASAQVDHVTKLRTGSYLVVFKPTTSVGSCPRVATLGRETGFAGNAAIFDGAAGEIGTLNAFTGTEGGILVTTRDSAGTPADQSFMLVVFC